MKFEPERQCILLVRNQTLVQILALLLSSLVILDKLLNFSVIKKQNKT